MTFLVQKSPFFKGSAKQNPHPPTPRSVVPKNFRSKCLPPQSRFPGRTPPTRPGNSTPRSASDGRASWRFPRRRRRPPFFWVHSLGMYTWSFQRLEISGSFGGLPSFGRKRGFAVSSLETTRKNWRNPKQSPMGQYLPTCQVLLVGPDFLAVINKKVRKWWTPTVCSFIWGKLGSWGRLKKI